MQDGILAEDERGSVAPGVEPHSGRFGTYKPHGRIVYEVVEGSGGVTAPADGGYHIVGRLMQLRLDVDSVRSLPEKMSQRSVIKLINASFPSVDNALLGQALGIPRGSTYTK